MTNDVIILLSFIGVGILALGASELLVRMYLKISGKSEEDLM